MASFPVLHRPIVSGGTTHSLHHLQPVLVKLDGKGRDGLDLTVRVSYHSHVYSKSDTAAATGHRFKDEGGKWREFCLDRYGWCAALPSICEDMVKLDFPTWESRDNGGKNHMSISEATPTSGTKYLVFYELLPSETEGIDIELVVKSAYEKEFDFSRVSRRYKVQALLRTVLYQGTKLPK